MSRWAETSAALGSLTLPTLSDGMGLPQCRILLTVSRERVNALARGATERLI
jgi:hypothetical protein